MNPAMCVDTMNCSGHCPECKADAEDRARGAALLDAVAHDEQLSAWAEEMECDLECFITAPETYDDGVQCAVAFKAAIKDLAAKIIDGVLREQAKQQG
jgi:hypothetical protein